MYMYIKLSHISGSFLRIICNVEPKTNTVNFKNSATKKKKKNPVYLTCPLTRSLLPMHDFVIYALVIGKIFVH